ncbi:probable glutamate receptor [Chanos chanos]|uniref:Glutamate receptor n=1 Tax=Chanos chanos TaxID=29144 RepID=A0A6J2W5J8_CHACN|nr:probable glutamate receptor [Chanos chanos]
MGTMAREGHILLIAMLLTGVCNADPQILSVTTVQQEPYTMSKGSTLEGYCVDLLSALSKKLGFLYNVHLVKDGKYGKIDESGSWTGMIGEIVRGEADLAIAPLTVTAAREAAVDMSQPFMQTGLSFIMKKDFTSDEQDHLSLLNPFSTEIWVGILIAYLVTSICIYLAARISPYEWDKPQTEENHFSLLHSFWYAAGALTLQGAGPHPKALSGRVIAAIWWLFSLGLLACYLANLNSWMQSDNKQRSLTSFEDLANQDIIEYGTVKGGSSQAFFQNSQTPTYRKIYEEMERKQSYSMTTEEGIRRAQEGSYAFIGEAVSLDLAMARYCDLQRSPEVIAMRGYGIAAPLGSPIVKNLSVAILQLSQSGELDDLYNKWWHNSCPADDAKVLSLKITNLKGIFLLLALGLTVGVLLALLELGAKSHTAASAEEKSCCSVLSSELSQRFGGSGEKMPAQTSEKCKA